MFQSCPKYVVLDRIWEIFEVNLFGMLWGWNAERLTTVFFSGGEKGCLKRLFFLKLLGYLGHFCFDLTVKMSECWNVTEQQFKSLKDFLFLVFTCWWKVLLETFEICLYIELKFCSLEIVLSFKISEFRVFLNSLMDAFKDLITILTDVTKWSIIGIIRV